MSNYMKKVYHFRQYPNENSINSSIVYTQNKYLFIANDKKEKKS